LVVHGDGKQGRDFVYVDDVITAMVAASTAPGVNGMVLNVGCGSAVSVGELVHLVIEATGASPEVIYNSHSSGGVSTMTADLGLVHEKLGFRPSIKLADGLRLTLQRDPRFAVRAVPG